MRHPLCWCPTPRSAARRTATAARHPPRDRCSAISSMRASRSALAPVSRNARGRLPTSPSPRPWSSAGRRWTDCSSASSPPAPCSCSPPASPPDWAFPSGLAQLERLEGVAAAALGRRPVADRPQGRAGRGARGGAHSNGLLERQRNASLPPARVPAGCRPPAATPLAGLQMQLELLESRPLDEAARPPPARLGGAVIRLANQLLALARAETGGRLVADASEVELVTALIDPWSRTGSNVPTPADRSRRRARGGAHGRRPYPAAGRSPT